MLPELLLLDKLGAWEPSSTSPRFPLEKFDGDYTVQDLRFVEVLNGVASSFLLPIENCSSGHASSEVVLIDTALL